MSCRLSQRLPVELVALTRAPSCLPAFSRAFSTSARRRTAPPSSKRVYITTPIFYCNAGE